MNKNKARSCVTLFILALVILPTTFFVWTKLTKSNRSTEEVKLAKLLDVNLESFPRETNLPFPYSYFETKLNSSMNISEVHKLIVGYERVLHCPNSIEIYYYYDSSDSAALRFKISYDESFNFKHSYLEDDNSRTISIENCEAGLIQP